MEKYEVVGGGIDYCPDCYERGEIIQLYCPECGYETLRERNVKDA